MKRLLSMVMMAGILALSVNTGHTELLWQFAGHTAIAKAYVKASP